MHYSVTLCLTLLVLAPSAVLAEHSGEVAESVVREGTRAAFEEFERQMIYKYFGEHTAYRDDDSDRDYREHDYKDKKNKDKGLPPGIRKKLARGGPMPPGIARRYLPDDLSHQLPPPPQGYERTIVGNDVLLVEVDSGRIADILVDAVLGE